MLRELNQGCDACQTLTKLRSLSLQFFQKEAPCPVERRPDSVFQSGRSRDFSMV